MLRLCVLLNEQLKSQLKKVNQRLPSAIRSHLWSLLKWLAWSYCGLMSRNWEIVPRESTWPKQVFSDFTASLEDLWNVSSNQTSFVLKMTVGFGTGFVLCLSYSIIWPELNGGSWINCCFYVQRMKSNQTWLSVVGFLKCHWLSALKSSVWIHQTNLNFQTSCFSFLFFITSCFLFFSAATVEAAYLIC